MHQKIYGVILVGGKGTRFWPISREIQPKQFLRILSGKSFFEDTIERLSKIIPKDRIFFVTVKNQMENILSQVASKNIIVEPVGKNTAAAIGLAAIHFLQEPENILIVSPSDHFVPNKNRFAEIIKKTFKPANAGYIVTIGIKPKYPETGYGYIKVDRSRKLSQDCFKVEKFIEKPDIDTARKFLKVGTNQDGFFWNSGIFVFKISVLLKEMEKYLPNLYKNLLMLRNLKDEDKIYKIYSKFKSISIDNGILEKSDKVAVVPAAIKWSDVGNWKALYEFSKKDKNRNVKFGNVFDVDTKKSLIYSTSKLIATLGLKNMIVIETPDAVLVCSKDYAQNVKELVNILSKRYKQQVYTYPTIYKPWGSFTVLDDQKTYKVKKLVVIPGQKLSLQMHNYRSEYWYVVSGVVKVTIDARVKILNKGESIYIPQKSKHKIENLSTKNAEIIEIQTGKILLEEDIVRFEDKYGRHLYVKQI